VRLVFRAGNLRPEQSVRAAGNGIGIAEGGEEGFVHARSVSQARLLAVAAGSSGEVGTRSRNRRSGTRHLCFCDNVDHRHAKPPPHLIRDVDAQPTRDPQRQRAHDDALVVTGIVA